MGPLIRKKGIFETNRIQYIPVSQLLVNPGQPRRLFDAEALEELANSIREHGILQPLSIRRGESGLELISGERRLRAARMAGLDEVPCILVDVDQESSSLLALVENLQRRDLNFWEEAVALDTLIRTYRLSQEEAARRIGKSQSAVANKLRLLKLMPDALALLCNSGFTERHARALLRLPTPALQLRAAQHIVRHRLTVSNTERYVNTLLVSLSDRPFPQRKPTFLIKDVRFFLNTLNRSLSLMQSAGIAAHCGREETDDAILLTIRIPK